MNYIPIDYIILIHDDYVIGLTGGLEGVKDYGQLESVCQNIQNDFYYSRFEDKLTHLVFSICQFHMFNDGNKRTSISVGAYFLNINGYGYCSDVFIEEMENIVLWLAQGIIDKEVLLKVIESIIENNDLTDEVKLEILSKFDDKNY